MRLYVTVRLERDSSQTPIGDFEIKTRIATTPEGAVRQMLVLAEMDRLDFATPKHLQDDPQALSHHLSGRNVHYDVSEHDLDVGDVTVAADATPAHLSDEEMIELQEWRDSGRISARARSLVKRFLDAPLQHQVATPEQREAYWQSLGLDDPALPKRKGTGEKR